MSRFKPNCQTGTIQLQSSRLGMIYAFVMHYAMLKCFVPPIKSHPRHVLRVSQSLGKLLNNESHKRDSISSDNCYNS